MEISQPASRRAGLSVLNKGERKLPYLLSESLRTDLSSQTNPIDSSVLQAFSKKDPESASKQVLSSLNVAYHALAAHSHVQHQLWDDIFT